VNERAFLPKPQARCDSKALTKYQQGSNQTNEARTNPKDLMAKVHGPMKRRMTNPPNTVLISGMPLCFA
jgi:hypothetical protein